MNKEFCELLEYLQEIEDTKKENTLNLPRVIAAKKIKLLKALGATDQLEQSSTTTTNVAIDDENLPLDEVFFVPMDFTRIQISVSFDDSIVVNGFMSIQRPEFDLKTYISCVKRLYSDDCRTENMCYLLCHARDFSEPKNLLFTFSDSGTVEVMPMDDEPTLSMSRQCPFTAKLMSLMDDLLARYCEAKYQQLNQNVTYLLLFITRKIYKDNTNFKNALKNPKNHKNYLDLCPLALSDRLPDDTPLLHNVLYRQDTFVTLILYAYLKSARLTRRVLEATCIADMKYTGLGLPMMFDKLVQLYRVPEGRLWDALCVYTETCESMFTLADFHDMQRKGECQEPPKTYTLFTYCRVLDGKYHRDMSGNFYKNFVSCYAMAHLIDKKLGMDKSHMRNAHWIQKLGPHKRYMGEKVAAEAYAKLIQ